MMTMNVAESMKDFQALVDWGTITAGQLRSSGEAAQARDVEVEAILRYDLGIPRRKLLEALALHYRCEWVKDFRYPLSFLPGLIRRGHVQTCGFPSHWTMTPWS